MPQLAVQVGVTCSTLRSLSARPGTLYCSQRPAWNLVASRLSMAEAQPSCHEFAPLKQRGLSQQAPMGLLRSPYSSPGVLECCRPMLWPNSWTKVSRRPAWSALIHTPQEEPQPTVPRPPHVQALLGRMRMRFWNWFMLMPILLAASSVASAHPYTSSIRHWEASQRHPERVTPAHGRLTLVTTTLLNSSNTTLPYEHEAK
mmetsp:Transcript_11972/g.25735  ORF Transcript_11972/g.25735 Transcript_11972/m.25735 type:complete len:201 (-) Transcript_11972:723-1325(-)